MKYMYLQLLDFHCYFLEMLHCATAPTFVMHLLSVAFVLYRHIYPWNLPDIVQRDVILHDVIITLGFKSIITMVYCSEEYWKMCQTKFPTRSTVTLFWWLVILFWYCRPSDSVKSGLLIFLRWRKGLEGIFKFLVIFSIFPYALDLFQGQKYDAFLKSYRSLFQSQTIQYINVEHAKGIHETHNNQLFLDICRLYMKKSTETGGLLKG